MYMISIKMPKNIRVNRLSNKQQNELEWREFEGDAHPRIQKTLICAI